MELQQVDSIHSSKDCITVVHAANDQSIDQGIAVSVVNVLLIKHSCLRHAVETASSDTSDIIGKHQLLVDSDAEAGKSAEKINS